MIRTIHVPLDCSAFGEHALPWALSVAELSGAAVELVHVLPYGNRTAAHLTPEGIEFYSDMVRRRSRLYLDKLAQRIREERGIDCATTLLEGDEATRIARHAEESGADLLALTTHGRGMLARFWLGSVADQLVRRSPVPLFLIRPESSPVDLKSSPRIRRALIPLDGEPFSETVLPHASELCRLWGSELHLFRVLAPVWPPLGRTEGDPNPFTTSGFDDRIEQWEKEQAEEAESHLGVLLARLREENDALTVRTKLTRNAAVASTILEEARESETDLIAMSTHGRGGLARLYPGSIADKVIRGAMRPMLIHRPTEN